jgi:hypothetical protein
LSVAQLPASDQQVKGCLRARPLVSDLGRRQARTSWHERGQGLDRPSVPGRPIGPWSRRTGAPEASATGRDRSPRVHAGYTRSRQVGDCNGHERSPRVARNRSSDRQRSRHQAPRQEAGRSSSLPTHAALRPAGSWPPGGGHRGRTSPSGRAGSRRCQAQASSFSPAVPPACHKQPSPAVSSGHSRSLEAGRWAGRRPLT